MLIDFVCVLKVDLKKKILFKMANEKLSWWNWAVLILLFLIFILLLIFTVSILIAVMRVKNTIDSVLAWSQNVLCWSNQLFLKFMNDIKFLENIIKKAMDEFNSTSFHFKELTQNQLNNVAASNI